MDIDMDMDMDKDKDKDKDKHTTPYTIHHAHKTIHTSQSTAQGTP